MDVCTIKYTYINTHTVHTINAYRYIYVLLYVHVHMFVYVNMDVCTFKDTYINTHTVHTINAYRYIYVHVQYTIHIEDFHILNMQKYIHVNEGRHEGAPSPSYPLPTNQSASLTLG